MSTLEEVATQFAKETKGFTVTVLADAGEYKTLLFSAGGGGWGHTMVHIYPGGCSTSGDMAHGWVFERDIAFFRGSISPRYWAEKLASTLREASAHLEFNADVFRASIDEIADTADVPDRLRADLRDELVELAEFVISDRPSAEFAIAELSNFTFPYTEYEEAMAFTVDEPYTVGCESFDYHFLWALHVLRAVAEKLHGSKQ